MRRMHRVAADHVHTFRDLVSRLYGEEARAVARTARRARLLTRRAGGLRTGE
jgi:monovalent cation:H+ antiporter-2, CPA2 family